MPYQEWWYFQILDLLNLSYLTGMRLILSKFILEVPFELKSCKLLIDYGMQKLA